MLLVFLKRRQWMSVLVRCARLYQSDDFAFPGKLRHATLNQWGQFIAESPSQDEQSFPVLRKFERQFIRSGIGKDRVRLKVELIFQSLKHLDELCTLRATQVRKVQHSNMPPIPKVHQSHHLVLRRVRLRRNQRDRQLVDCSRTNSNVDFNQRRRRAGIHHDEYGVRTKP